METITYLDFDLLIQPVGTAYSARVQDSPGGQASESFTREDLAALSALVGKNTSNGDHFQKFGQQLYMAVFHGKVKECLVLSLDKVKQEGKGLRIRLRLNEVPELAGLPWEYLYDPTNERFFALSDETPIVRYLEMQGSEQPELAGPLRILIVIAHPYDNAPLNVKEECQKIQDALSDLEHRGLVVIERLEQATWKGLQKQLHQKEYHILHFIGHGWVDEHTQESGLVLEDTNRRGDHVPTSVLARLFHNGRSLRLVFFNACQWVPKIKKNENNLFADTVQKQLPFASIIAMQFPISDQAAIALIDEFYQVLADGNSVEVALTQARLAISKQHRFEWGTPVLFTRVADTRLFEFADNHMETGVMPQGEKRIPSPTQEERPVTPPILEPPEPILPVKSSILGLTLLVIVGIILWMTFFLINIGNNLESTPANTVAILPTATQAPATQTPTNETSIATEAILPTTTLILATQHSTPTQTSIPTKSPTPTELPPTPTSSNNVPKDDMVYVPEGEFEMGSADGPSNEQPRHTVYLDAFSIDRTEVTNAMFVRFVQETGHQTNSEKEGFGWVVCPPGSNEGQNCGQMKGTDWQHPHGPESNLEGLDDHPVVQVSWNDANAYCEWKERRLPTEAEWEKAAGGTDERKYPWGNEEPTGEVVNFCDQNCLFNNKNSSTNDGYQHTSPVGSYSAGASPYGALDMAGNVWEWVADGYDENYYASSPRDNPIGPSNLNEKSVRGGSWNNTAQFIRVHTRAKGDLNSRNNQFGFRCAKSP